MSQPSDDTRRLESLLRAASTEIEYPSEPDVRRNVRERLASAGETPGTTGRGLRTRPDENHDGDVMGGQQSTTSWREKSLIRQLLEMAAAVLVLALFTGALALIYQAQIGDNDSDLDGDVPAGESVDQDQRDDTVQSDSSDTGADEWVTAIAYAQEDDGESILVLADIKGNVLQEVRDLPQHQFGPERFYVEVAVSPDGTQLIYMGSGENGGNLYIRDIESGDDRPLVVESESSDMNPTWSPDGEWIAFERNKDDHAEIFVVRADGSGLRQLTETDDGAGLPVWSPDGERIAFLSPPSWEALGYQLDANPAEVTPFAIYVVNADGTNQRAIPGAEVFDPQNFAPRKEPGSAQIWSPDSQRIAFTVYEAHEDRDGASGRLAIADIENRSIDVHGSNISVEFPSWSPGGDSIAVSGHADNGNRTLYLFDTRTKEFDPYSVPDESVAGTQWSPDGRYILMGAHHDGGRDQYVLDVKSGELELVAESTIPVSSAAWVRLSGEMTSVTAETPEPTPTITSPGSGELPKSTFQDMSTEDVTLDIPDDQMLALGVQRWVDGRRVMSVFDVDGNLLREFDEIPNIELEDAPPTIVADVSPDGRSVVYQHNYEDGGADISVMSANDEEPRQLTVSGDNYRPVWSPDGERIAFLSDRAHGEERNDSQRSEVFVMDRDGSNLRQLSDTPFGAGQIKWSHDGSMIAFASPGFHAAVEIPENERPPEYPFQLFVVDVESGEQRELEGAAMEDVAGLGLASQPWLTDNSGVLFERKGRAYVARSDGSGSEGIDDIPVAAETHQLLPATSPDGKSVAFNWTQADGDSPIWILDLEDGNVTELSSGLTDALPAGWSPDGSLLAATAPGEPTEELPPGSVRGDIWVLSSEDRTAQRVVTNVSDNDVRWLIVRRE